MEQLVARRAHNPKVVSSSLAPATHESLKSEDLRLFYLYLIFKNQILLKCYFQIGLT